MLGSKRQKILTSSLANAPLRASAAASALMRMLTALEASNLRAKQAKSPGTAMSPRPALQSSLLMNIVAKNVSEKVFQGLAGLALTECADAEI